MERDPLVEIADRLTGLQATLNFGEHTRSCRLVHPEDLAHARSRFAEALRSSGISLTIEVRMRHRDGSWRHVEVTSTNLLDDPSVRGIVLNWRDITERKLLQERLEHQATHDLLTDLPDWTLLIDRLEHAILQAARHGKRVAVLFVDLDGFKPINDSMGHEAVRASDTVGRFGGDEFAVLLENMTGEAEVTMMVERIMEGFSDAISVAGRELRLGASVGISCGFSGEEKPKDLLHKADAALYRAKRGKAPHRVYDPAADLRTGLRSPGRLELKGELRRAIRREEFVIYFQPMVRLGRFERYRRARGPPALGAPGERSPAPRRVHAARRGDDGPDRPHGEVGPRGGLPPGQGVAGALRWRAAPTPPSSRRR